MTEFLHAAWSLVTPFTVALLIVAGAAVRVAARYDRRR